MSASPYPQGVAVHELSRNADERGWLTEIHRDSWCKDVELVQWVAVRARANSLRGLHAHFDRWEFYVLLAGAAFMAMRDIRPRSPTHGMLSTLEVNAEAPCIVQVPPALLHGTYFREDTLVAIGFSAYYTGDANERGCRWNDPQAGIAWPCTRPIVSARDAALPSYAELLRATALA